MARNEGRALAEWAACHFALGVREIRLYDNGSDDDTAELASRLSQHFRLVRVPWTQPGAGHDTVQRAAFDDAAAWYIGRADFVAFIDLDEFLLPAEGMSLPEALAGYDHSVGAIAVNQRCFGSSWHDKYQPAPVLGRFTRRASLDSPEHCFVKSIARPECLLPFRTVHSVELNTGHCVFPDGTPYEPGTPHPGKARRIVTTGPLRLHHYLLKSLQEFRAKQRRFSGTDLADRYDDSYFLNRDEITNAEEDRFALRFLPLIEATLRDICIPPPADTVMAAPPPPTPAQEQAGGAAGVVIGRGTMVVPSITQSLAPTVAGGGITWP